MELGLVTIQRNRGPWLVEWLAFHYLVGFRKFYFYAHLCDDNTAEVLTKLAGKLNIKSFVIAQPGDKVQLMAYQHACDNFINEVDWMCFLDGDEFIFPTSQNTMQEALAGFETADISAIGVYNCNFGSSGHMTEPAGLITENFRMKAHDHFMAQRRVKSIVKGHQKVTPSACSNIFITPHGTVDELMRPVTWGYMPDYIPSYTHFQFNHYVCQSREYFSSFKQHSGHADADGSVIREEVWWDNFNTNDVFDESLIKFSVPLRILVEQLNEFLVSPTPASN